MIQLASRAIQAGREARRNGFPLSANPYESPAPTFMEGDNGQLVRFRDQLDYNDLWYIGWKIEDKYGESA